MTAVDVDAWIEALVQVVDRTAAVAEVSVSGVPREAWSGAAYEAYAGTSSRLLSQVASGQEAVRRAARALLVFAEEPASEGAEGRLGERLAASHPGAPVPVVDGVPEVGTPADEVLKWWRNLDEEERRELRVWGGGGLGVVGSLVGLPGLPSGARDRFNRDALRLDLARSRGAERRTADAVDRALTGRDGQQRHLLAYDPRAAGGDGEVVVGVGDVDGADRLVAVVPGITTTAVDAPRYVRDVATLVDEADALSKDPDQTAGLFWLGYDAPDGFTDRATWTRERARDGGDALVDDLSQVQAVRAAVRGEDDAGRVSVLGHSYGSTVVSFAASGPGLDVDAVALLGSPGAGPADTAAELGVEEVYVGRDSRDPVAALGDQGWVRKGGVSLGADPASDDFGAVRFRAERIDREVSWGAVKAHTSYFDPGTESHDNLARVVAGRPDLIEPAAHAFDPWWGAPQDPEWARKVGAERE